MKGAKLWRRECSTMAVLVLLAAGLLFRLTARAAPRGADEAVRGKEMSDTEVRLVTGDPEQINQVVVGSQPPSAILGVNPAPVPAGVTPPNPYPPGTTIVGNELRAEVGGFRAWFHLQVSNWDDDGDGLPTVLTYQIKIDCTNFKGVNAVPPNPGVDLAPAVVACSSGTACTGGSCVGGSKDGSTCATVDDCSANRFCQETFGEPWTKCANATCRSGYLDFAGSGRPNSWCATSGGGCSAGDVVVEDGNFIYSSASNLATGHPDEPSSCEGGPRNGGGCSVADDCPPPGKCTGPKSAYYGGTLVLDIPAAAKGRYTVTLDNDETFVRAPGNPPVNIPTLSEDGFVVKIGAGR